MHSEHKLVISHLDSAIISENGTEFFDIHLDNNLKWGMNIDSICKQLNSSYYAINRIKISLPLESLMSIYHSLVYTHLWYNIL